MTQEPGQPEEPTTDGTPASTTSQTAAAVRAVLRRAWRDMLVLVAVLAVLGIAVGAAVSGAAGVWGAGIGVVVALVFSGTTVLSMLATADAPAATTGAVVLGAWLAKMLVLVVTLAVLDDRSFYDRRVLVVVLVLAVLGSAVLDYRAVVAGRVPYVSPSDGRGPERGDDD